MWRSPVRASAPFGLRRGAGANTKVAACLSEGGTFCGTYEKRVGHIPWGQARHVVIGDCVNAIEWSVPWHQVMQMAFARRLALVYHLPLNSF